MQVLQARNRDSSRRKSLYLVALVATLLSEPSRAAVSKIRGLDPSLRQRYEPQNGRFACLGGKASIPFDRVNDDFCDCVDGTDEPGTSACSNGHFYCRNRGHQPQLLNSSSVDDRICDCCDGTDEQPGVCKNTCSEAGAANRAALKARAAAFKQGLTAREKYVKEAVSSREKWEADASKLHREELDLQKTVGRLQGKKERIEKLEAKQREKEEAERKREEEREAAKKAAEGGNAQAQLDTPQGVGEAPPEVPDTAVSASQEEEAAASGQKPEEELSEEEKGRRIAAQWTHDPEAVGKADPVESPIEPEAKVHLSQPAADDSHPAPKLGASQEAKEGQAEEEEEEAKIAAQSGAYSKAREWVFGKLGWDVNVTAQTAAHRQKVKDEYFAQNGKLVELTRQKTDLRGKLATDFGPEEAFLPLMDKCFSADVEKYVYEICPFKSAAQKDGAMSTSLGVWKGFEDDYSALVFTNGQHCWNGPNRSLRVALECGAKEEVSGVEEPSRCEYRAKMTTPAACSPEAAEQVRKLLEEAERDLSAKEEL